MNDIGVTPRERAVATLDAVRVFEDALAAENARPVSVRDFARVSMLVSRINRATRVAGVWAQLATADAIARTGLPVADVQFKTLPPAVVDGFGRQDTCACGRVALYGSADDNVSMADGFTHGRAACLLREEDQ